VLWKLTKGWKTFFMDVDLCLLSPLVLHCFITCGF